MTNEKAKNLLTARLKCLELVTSARGCTEDCDNCQLCYAQGTLGEQQEALRVAIDVLQTEPCDDCISRQVVLDKIKEVCFSKKQEWINFRVSQGSNGQRDFLINYIEQLQSVTPTTKDKGE